MLNLHDNMNSIDSGVRHDFLNTPLNLLSPDELINYFQDRSAIRYFAVADPAQVSREKIDRILLNHFEFNEEVHQLPDDFDWTSNPSSDIEWSILWHKFYYAVGLGIAFTETGKKVYLDKWMELTSSWIRDVPFDFHSSDVTGRRIQNWVFAHYYFISPNSFVRPDPVFYRDFLESLHQQVDYLCDNLTPARNHRTLELYAIFLTAVVFPEFYGAGKWLIFSIKELLKNLQNDLMPDGVHCELSTDYHHIVLRNFMGIKKLALLNNIQLPSGFDEHIKKALLFSVYIHKPDGNIPSLSDGDTGNFLYLLEQGYEFYDCEFMRYAATQGTKGQPPEERSKAFADSGYYILRSGWGSATETYQDERYLVFDCGPLGEGNHGHLDALSFEMAAFGKSLIVDPGRYTYDESGGTNWRVLFRSSRYHNTVVVDGKDQTCYAFNKTKFKIKGPAPDIELRSFVSSTDFDYLHGIARSYEYPVIHERKILFPNLEYWVICDVMRASESHDYELLFHLSSNAQNHIQLNTHQEGLWLDSPQLMMMQPEGLSGAVSVEQGFVSPTYGIKHPAPIVKISKRAMNFCFCTLLYPYSENKPVIKTSLVPVISMGKPVSHNEAFGLAIEINKNGQIFTDLIYFAHTDHKTLSIGGNVPEHTYGFARKNGNGQIIQHSPDADLWAKRI